MQSRVVRPELRVPRANRVRKYQAQRLDLALAKLIDPIELPLKLRFGAEIPCHVSPAFCAALAPPRRASLPDAKPHVHSPRLATPAASSDPASDARLSGA